MKDRFCRHMWVIFAATLVLSGAVHAANADAALAQDSPELRFLNGPVTQRAEQNGGALADCEAGFEAHAETAKATVFVLLSGSTEATNVEFKTEVPSAGGDAPTTDEDPAGSYERLLEGNVLSVDPTPAPNERDDLSVRPSEIKAFVLAFRICSGAEPPAWSDYMFGGPVPVEWSNFAGQLVVRPAGKPSIAPAAVALQLNRPAPGYEKANFLGVVIVFLVFALVFTAALLHFGWSDGDYAGDFKAGLVVPSTAGAAILGTLFTATILPNETLFMPKGQYATLNAVFALIALLVGFLFNNLKKRRLLLVGAGIVLGAGTGEAVALGFVLKEMSLQGSLPTHPFAFQAALLVVWGVMAVVAAWAVVERIRVDPPG